MGMSVSSLQYWLRRDRANGATEIGRPKASQGTNRGKKPGPVSLLEVELEGAPARSDARRFEIELPSGVQLRIEPGFDPQEVRRLLIMLREEAG
jgi:hypothetical protein